VKETKGRDFREASAGHVDFGEKPETRHKPLRCQ